MDLLNRRELLQAAVAWIVGRIVGGDVGATSEGISLLSGVGASESAAVVGRAYLEDRPEERDPQSVARLVLEGLQIVPQSSGRALRRALESRIRMDFDERKVVSVAGWVLSQTEARLAALAALAHDQRFGT